MKLSVPIGALLKHEITLTAGRREKFQDSDNDRFKARGGAPHQQRQTCTARPQLL